MGMRMVLLVFLVFPHGSPSVHYYTDSTVPDTAPSHFKISLVMIATVICKRTKFAVGDH